VRAAVQHHLHPLGAEPDDEVLTVRDDGHADAAGQRPPLPQLEDVFRDVRFIELAAVFPQPILDEVAVGSSWRSVDLDRRHGTSRAGCHPHGCVDIEMSLSADILDVKSDGLRALS
jgi:hypothetical protein